MSYHSVKNLPYMDSRKEGKHCLIGCLSWLAGLLAGTILFLIFLLAYQPELMPKTIRQLPQKTSQALSRLKIGKSEHISSTNPTAILMYHYVRAVDKLDDPVGFSLSVSPAVFERQIKYLTTNFKIISFADFMAGKIPEKAVILTFDDGYEDFYTTAAPILKKYNLPSASFIITSKIGKEGYLSSRQIIELSRKYRVEFGSHTVSHPNLSKANYSQQTREIKQSQADLEDIIGKKVSYFCYPSGQYNAETLEILADYGYKIGVTTEEALAKRNQNWLILPRVRVSGHMKVLGLQKKLERLFNSSE